jgi:GNAT superfamily N-acetyltransferase
MRKRKKLIPKIRAPRGFHFRIRKEYYERQLECVAVELWDSKTKSNIGHVNLVRAMRGFVETHSYLEASYHNKKLGALMYSKAIQWALKNGFKVRAGGPSEQAQRVWRGKSIRENFKIRVIRHRSYSDDPNYDDFFAYSK